MFIFNDSFCYLKLNLKVTILAETYEVQQELLAQGIQVQNISEIDEVFCIRPASIFARILSRLAFY